MVLEICELVGVVSVGGGGCIGPKQMQLSTVGLPYKGRAIKGLVVCNNWNLEPLDLLNGLALGFYQPSPGVLIVLLL